MRLSLDRTLALGAIIIALGSASTSYLQYRSERHYAQLVFRPRLNLTPYLERKGGRNGLYLSNDGAGPAQITGIRVMFEGRTFEGPGESPWPVIERAMGLSGCFRRAWPVGEFTLRAGERVVQIAPTRAVDLPQCAGATVKLLTRSNLRFVIDYADLDGARFVLDDAVTVNDSDVVLLGNLISGGP